MSKEFITKKPSFRIYSAIYKIQTCPVLFCKTNERLSKTDMLPHLNPDLSNYLPGTEAGTHSVIRHFGYYLTRTNLFHELEIKKIYYLQIRASTGNHIQLHTMCQVPAFNKHLILSYKYIITNNFFFNV